MKLIKSKKGFIGGLKAIILTVIGAVLGIIVVFTLVSSMAPQLAGAAGNLSQSGLPFATHFNPTNGVVLLIFMVMLLVAIIAITYKMAIQK